MAQSTASCCYPATALTATKIALTHLCACKLKPSVGVHGQTAVAQLRSWHQYRRHKTCIIMSEMCLAKLLAGSTLSQFLLHISPGIFMLHDWLTEKKGRGIQQCWNSSSRISAHGPADCTDPAPQLAVCDPCFI